MSKRVLVVEDEEDDRRIMRDLPTSVGYEIIEAVTGLEGVVPCIASGLRNSVRVNDKNVAL